MGAGRFCLLVIFIFSPRLFMNPNYNDSDVTSELQVLSQIIFGEPASKANSRRVVRFGGMSRLIKSAKALSYSDVFRQQCKPLAALMTGDLRITLDRKSVV
jgi:hypothetical protein